MHLFEIAKAYDSVYNWFKVLKTTYRCAVLAYVIMPNHVHTVIAFNTSHISINTIIGNGKRFMAYDIIKRLQTQNESSLLTKLQLAVQAKDKSRGKIHEVWKESFDVKECRTEKFILQKFGSSLQFG